MRRSSSGCRSTSRVCLLNSGSSSAKSTPLCARDISPGCGDAPPPTSATSKIYENGVGGFALYFALSDVLPRVIMQNIRNKNIMYNRFLIIISLLYNARTVGIIVHLHLIRINLNFYFNSTLSDSSYFLLCSLHICINSSLSSRLPRLNRHAALLLYR